MFPTKQMIVKQGNWVKQKFAKVTGINQVPLSQNKVKYV